MLDHTYAAVEDGEYPTVHIPKNIRVLETLLEEMAQEPEALCPSGGRAARI
jgi:hypothetical protein